MDGCGNQPLSADSTSVENVCDDLLSERCEVKERHDTSDDTHDGVMSNSIEEVLNSSMAASSEDVATSLQQSPILSDENSVSKPSRSVEEVIARAEAATAKIGRAFEILFGRIEQHKRDKLLLEERLDEVRQASDNRIEELLLENATLKAALERHSNLLASSGDGGSTGSTLTFNSKKRSLKEQDEDEPSAKRSVTDTKDATLLVMAGSSRSETFTDSTFEKKLLPEKKPLEETETTTEVGTSR